MKSNLLQIITKEQSHEFDFIKSQVKCASNFKCLDVEIDEICSARFSGNLLICLSHDAECHNKKLLDNRVVCDCRIRKKFAKIIFKQFPMNIFIARQPIVDRNRNVFAYELLFRNSLENYFVQGTDPNEATSWLMSDSVLQFGLDMLLGDRKVFINFTRELMVKDCVALLPDQFYALEISENTPPNPEIIEACNRLKEHGYYLAIDNFTFQSEEHSILEFADIVKIDVKALGSALQKKIIKQYSPKKTFIAEKVETNEEFIEAKEAEYKYFQGYFFSKPVIISRKDIPGSKLQYLHLLKEINNPDLEINQLVPIIKRDLSLSYKLLKYINSSFFGLRHVIKSIQHALVVMGEKEVRKWACLIALGKLGEDKPPILIVTSLIRAKFCEALSSLIQQQDRSQDFFLLGMFSLVDAIVGRPMDELLLELPLDEEIKAALLGGKNLCRDILELVVAYEKGEWGKLSALTETLSIEEEKIPGLYLQSVDWANQSFPE